MYWTRQLIAIIVLGFLLQWAVSFLPHQKTYASCGIVLSTGQRSCLNYPVTFQLGYPGYFVTYETHKNACWKDAFVPLALLINIIIWHGIATVIVLATNRYKRKKQKDNNQLQKSKPSRTEVMITLVSALILIYLWWATVSFLFRTASCDFL